ncbi:MAG: hypothetical protein K0S46_2217 [Moraxellaceae bacterium]|nr:hypothetical protein [Moraxellaceae bacterium]
MRAILAGQEMTGEQLALSNWWGGMNRVQQGAMFQLAGIVRGVTGKPWMKLPEAQRAALVLTVRALAENLAGIMGTLQAVRSMAVAKLREESAMTDARAA